MLLRLRNDYLQSSCLFFNGNFIYLRYEKEVTLNQSIGAKTYLEIRKYLLDLSKLTFGGIILSGIMGGMTDTLTLILMACNRPWDIDNGF